MTPRTIYAGADPGLSGAIAFFEPVNAGKLVIYDMPTLPIRRNDKDKRDIDLKLLARIVEPYGPFVARALVEQVNAMPDQGITSAFTFGRAFGTLEMALAFAGMPIEYIAPVKWKRMYGLSSDKDASRALAILRFPNYAELFKSAGDDGRAEAALLAFYASKMEA